MEVIEVLALVGKILCFVIGGALFIGSAMALLLNGVEVVEDESRLKVKFSLTFLIPIILAFIPWLNVLIVIVYIAFAFYHWSKKGEDIMRIRKNWVELVAVRNSLFAGIALILLGILLVVFL